MSQVAGDASPSPSPFGKDQGGELGQRHQPVGVRRWFSLAVERRHGEAEVRDGVERVQSFARSTDAPEKGSPTQARRKTEDAGKPSKEVHDSMIACGSDNQGPALSNREKNRFSPIATLSSNNAPPEIDGRVTLGPRLEHEH